MKYDKVYGYDFEVFSKQKPTWWCVTFVNKEYYKIILKICSIKDFMKKTRIISLLVITVHTMTVY